MRSSVSVKAAGNAVYVKRSVLSGPWRSSMKSRYDVLVIGGGPAGSVAAQTAAQAGFSTCLLEKRPAIGSPVRCAEGVGKEIREFIDPDPKWISAEIARAAIVAPDGTTMYLDSAAAGNKVGYMLERKIFDRALIRQAAAAGADIAVKTLAKSPIIENGAVKGAIIEGRVPEVRAEVIIAADGVESVFARMCGIDTTVPAGEMMTCAQVLMSGIDIENNTNCFHVGNTVAPEGYLWVFPKGEGIANVGVGISGRKSGNGHRAKDYLDTFLRRKFPDGKTIEFVAGGVPVCRPLPSTVADGLIVAGDAAHVVDPITGGGILNAMYTGRFAGEVAGECISRGNCSSRALAGYDHRWRDSSMGKSLERNYRFKEYFLTLSDDALNSLVRSATKIQLAEFSMLQLAKELVIRNPRLLAGLPLL
jgi:digeranylgeranylglycerophospholipid reductase